VGAGPRLGGLATGPGPLKPTAGLIQQSADTAGKTVTIETRLAEGAFDALIAGDRARHDELITENARDLASRSDVIVLAQASMWRMAQPLAEQTGVPVLTSPRLGVQQVADRV